MATDHTEIQNVEIIIGPIAPSLPSRLRGYLQTEHGVNLADITSRKYDRDFSAPLIARFILDQVKNDPAAHVNGPRLEQKVHALSADREFDRERYLALRQKAKRNITRLMPHVPEMQTAQELIDSYRGEEVEVVINDVLIAIGSLRHTLASRNAAVVAGETPPQHIQATA